MKIVALITLQMLFGSDPTVQIKSERKEINVAQTIEECEMLFNEETKTFLIFTLESNMKHKEAKVRKLDIECHAEH